VNCGCHAKQLVMVFHGELFWQHLQFLPDKTMIRSLRLILPENPRKAMECDWINFFYNICPVKSV